MRFHRSATALALAALALAAASCSGPPLPDRHAAMWWIGAPQTLDQITAGPGLMLGIGGEFIAQDFSMMLRGRASWSPGEETDRSEIFFELAFLDFRGTYCATEWLFGWGFHFLDDGSWGTGLPIGIGFYRLLTPHARLELVVWDYLWVGSGGSGDAPQMGSEPEVALMLAFGF